MERGFIESGPSTHSLKNAQEPKPPQTLSRLYIPPIVGVGGGGKQRRYTIDEYQRAMKLLKIYGLRKVSKIMNIPMSTLQGWRNGWYKPPSTRFKLEPSPELAYVVGCLLSDAWTYDTGSGSYRICLEAKDRDFVENFSICLAKVLNKKPGKIYYRKERGEWLKCYESVAFYNWWREQDLTSLKTIIEYDGENIKAFIRGFMDGDGCISTHHVSAINSNLELLEYIRYLLGKLNIRTGKIRLKSKAGSKFRIEDRIVVREKDCYSLHINPRDYLEKIGFSIRRKNESRS